MALLPVDTDVLEDICRTVARDNYGFIYVSDSKGKIKSAYESADIGLLATSSLSGSDLREALNGLAADEFTDLEQLRDGVFYIDPFGATGNENITDQLTNLFGQRLVVTGETLRSRFSLAIDDIDFFVSELADRDYVRRITAGKRDYYTIGPRLKEHADDVGLDARLVREASNGKMAHSDLEGVIDVAATADVIRYLDREGYIVDLDGSYLVEAAIDEYGRYLAEEIEGDVEATFEDAAYVLPRAEFEQVVENEIDSRFDVLSQARSVRSDLLAAIRGALLDRLALTETDQLIVATDSFDAFVEDHARRIHSDVKAEQDQLPGTLSEWVDLAEEHVTDLQVSPTTAVNEFVRESVTDRYRTVVDEAEFGGMAT